MVEQAVKELPIDLSRSYLVGDHAKDMEMARRVGAKRVLVKTKVPGSPEEDGECGASDAVVSSLSDAAEWILADVEKSEKGRDEGDTREGQGL